MSNVFQAHRELVGARIRSARLDAKKSHDQLAREVGSSRQHLIKLEKGQHMPRPEMLTAIAEATGKDESFFTESDEEDSSLPSFLELLEALRPIGRLFDRHAV